MPAPRKPTHLHVIDGTFRPDRHALNPTGAIPIDPAPRPDMSPLIVDAYRELIAAGGAYLARSDVIAVEMAAALVTKSRRGEASAADIAQLVSLLNKLGLTPAGRRGLDPVIVAPAKENPFAQFRKTPGHAPKD